MTLNFRPLIKVVSPSFSKNSLLVSELKSLPIRVELNKAGIRYTGQKLVDFLSDADGAIIGLESVDVGLLDKCPRLKIISKYGVGLDNIDLNACNDRGVAIGWTPGINKRSVSEVVVGQMIGLSRNLFTHSALLRGGNWQKDGGHLFSEKTVGIIGLGNIGQDLAKLLQAFGCKLLGNDIKNRSVFARNHNVKLVSKEEIFFKSDILTLHVPLTTATHQLINKRALDLMHDDAFLINTSRGSVIDQTALKNALINGSIAGAAVDVFVHEPPSDREFLQLPNLVPTPHLSGNSYESVLAMGRSSIKHIEGKLNVSKVDVQLDTKNRFRFIVK
jgi:phosphoglycerate dehydrogenase-like enzyme